MYYRFCTPPQHSLHFPFSKWTTGESFFNQKKMENDTTSCQTHHLYSQCRKTIIVLYYTSRKWKHPSFIPSIPLLMHFIHPFHPSIHSIHPSIHSIHPSIPSIHPFHPSIHSIHPSIHSIHPSIHSIHPSIPSIHPSIPSIHPFHPSIHPSIHSIHPSIHPFLGPEMIEQMDR